MEGHEGDYIAVGAGIAYLADYGEVVAEGLEGGLVELAADHASVLVGEKGEVEMLQIAESHVLHGLPGRGVRIGILPVVALNRVVLTYPGVIFGSEFCDEPFADNLGVNVPERIVAVFVGKFVDDGGADVNLNA